MSLKKPEQAMSSTPDITGILENTKELDRLRKEQEEVLVEVNKIHKKLRSCKLQT